MQLENSFQRGLQVRFTDPTKAVGACSDGIGGWCYIVGKAKCLTAFAGMEKPHPEGLATDLADRELHRSYFIGASSIRMKA